MTCAVRIELFVTCLFDLFQLSVGFATGRWPVPVRCRP